MCICHLLHPGLGLQQGVIEADIAINTFAAPRDRSRIRIAVTETGVIDWRDK